MTAFIFLTTSPASQQDSFADRIIPDRSDWSRGFTWDIPLRALTKWSNSLGSRNIWGSRNTPRTGGWLVSSYALRGGGNIPSAEYIALPQVPMNKRPFASNAIRELFAIWVQPFPSDRKTKTNRGSGECLVLSSSHFCETISTQIRQRLSGSSLWFTVVWEYF